MTDKQMNLHPRFITFEGPDGGGKTTQIKKFVAYLESQGHEVLQTREPGGTEIGAKIRELLLTGDPDALDGVSETLLFFADRSEHLRQKIIPALNSGKWVVSDRFVDATRAYQITHGVSPEFIDTMVKKVVSVMPSLTFLLDVPAEISLQRKGVQVETGLNEDRFEKMGDTFQAKVRQTFLEIAKAESHRIRVIDASQSMEDVEKAIWQGFQDFLAQTP